uniref:Secreted protein n=1 Tax=Vitis vinifera TaxID=29760 RepID=A5C2K4_VITVI|nr:hypothetical protein VITISV_032075 [Vitis vinifera]
MLLITTFCLIWVSHSRNSFPPPFLRVSHSRNSSPPPFHPGVSYPKFLSAAIPPGVSHPEFLSAAIPSGCLTPGIPLRRHSTRMPHTWNPIRRRSTFSGCLTSGILSS